MTQAAHFTLPPQGNRFERRLGSYSRGEPGPFFVAMGGMHGCEPSGPLAIRRVLTELSKHRLPLRGSFIGLACNLKALVKNERYLDRDLNRRWFDEVLNRMMAKDPSEYSSEDKEQVELLDEIQNVIDATDRPIVFLDLHSTSAQGIPFSCMADTLRNRKIALTLPIPVVLGLEEVVDGTMLGYLNDLGHIAVAVEGGQHTDPETINNHESALWLSLVAAGCLKKKEVPDYDSHRRRLKHASRGKPPVLEIRHHHLVHDDDEFIMEPGFTNFDRISKGAFLASDRNGKMVASKRGLILMPRYQSLGEDGFFICRPVDAFWLRLSAGLRKLRLDRLIPLLPGVKIYERDPDRLIVNRSVARFLVLKIFHLFGYRRRHQIGQAYVFSRRRPDFAALKNHPASNGSPGPS